MQEIKLLGGAEYANQEFSAQLNGKTIVFRLHYCGYGNPPFWNLDLYYKGEPIVQGLTLVGGCDLLSPYRLGIGSLVLVGDDPTLDNLGSDCHLIWDGDE